MVEQTKFIGMDELGDTWKIIQRSNDNWYWQRIARNGAIVGEPLKKLYNAEDCIEDAKKNEMTCELTEL